MKTPSTIDVSVAQASWTKALRTPRAIARKAAGAALIAAGGKRPVEIAVALTSDAVVRELNALFRGQDKPTNVLSFPAGVDAKRLPKAAAAPLGDVAIAYGVAAREAKAQGKPLKAHLSHLVVHGVLHLLGYDHETDDDAETMERLERRILARLGVADPYGEPSSPRKRARR